MAMRRLGLGSLVLLQACVLGNPRELRARPAPEVRPASTSARPRAPEGQWRELGRSLEGRPLRARTFGSGPRRVLWIGGIHGNEREGSVATAELPAAFGERNLAQAVTLTILEDANPDGTAHDRRENHAGVDLNRNFPAANFDARRARFGESPLSQPEARVVHDLILAIDPHLVVVAHSWRGKHFINFDGPAEALARAFSKTSGYPLVRSGAIGETPGSLGSWVGRDLGKAILTLEWLHGSPPHKAWGETRAAILDAIAGEETG